MSVNKVILLGRVGKDPEVKGTAGGGTVAKFSVATSKKWVDKQGAKQENTTWHNIVVWGNAAEKYVAPYVKKGAMIYIEGEIQVSTWESDNGTKNYRTEILAGHLELTGGKSEASPNKEQPPVDRAGTNQMTAAEAHFAQESVPF